MEVTRVTRELLSWGLSFITKPNLARWRLDLSVNLNIIYTDLGNSKFLDSDFLVQLLKFCCILTLDLPDCPFMCLSSVIPAYFFFYPTEKIFINYIMLIQYKNFDESGRNSAKIYRNYRREFRISHDILSP